METLSNIGVGTAVNDGTGDFPHVAGGKINANNAIIQEAIGALETAQGGLSHLAMSENEFESLEEKDNDTIYYTFEEEE